MNPMTKYTDDCSLLVPEGNDVDICLEFQHIIKWASFNKLSVNMSKTKEILFHRPSPKNYLPLAETPGIERVIKAKTPGVWLQPELGTRKHIEYIPIHQNWLTFAARYNLLVIILIIINTLCRFVICSFIC